jgi:hypothetical protein
MLIRRNPKKVWFLMQWFSGSQNAEPEKVRRVLETLRDRLQSELGDGLISLIAYGDFVKPGDYDPRRSEVNLMLVLADISTPVLDRIVDAISTAKRKVRLAVMTLTEEDLVQSCDVFPVKFVDMQEHHRLICGRDVLGDLKIADDHLRLRCEQELKNLMIRLRASYLNQAKKPAALRTVMTDSVGPLLGLLTIGLTLKTGISPEENGEILAACREEFGLDLSVLQTVLDVRHGSSVLPLTEVPTVYNGYMKAVHDAATAIDRLEV